MRNAQRSLVLTAVIHTYTLKQEEAELLAKKLDAILDGKQDRWSIAEVFNKQTNKPKDRKMGFV